LYGKLFPLLGILIYICRKFHADMKIEFEDKDLEELITTGRNSKYKKYTRNAKFMKALATAYNYMRLVGVASDLRAISFLHYEQLAGTNGMSSIRVVNGMVERILFREFDGGISITVLSLDDTHYGNKK
jgi:plasmid maintenance system killer protein